jgi:hypothetical protein
MAAKLVLKQDSNAGLRLLDGDTAGEIDAGLAQLRLAEIAKIVAGDGGDEADGVTQGRQVVGGDGR